MDETFSKSFFKAASRLDVNPAALLIGGLGRWDEKSGEDKGKLFQRRSLFSPNRMSIQFNPDSEVSYDSVNV